MQIKYIVLTMSFLGFSCKVRKSAVNEVSASMSPVSVELSGLKRLIDPKFGGSRDGKSEKVSLLTNFTRNRISDAIRSNTGKSLDSAAIFADFLIEFDEEWVNGLPLPRPEAFLKRDDLTVKFIEPPPVDFLNKLEELRDKIRARIEKQKNEGTSVSLTYSLADNIAQTEFQLEAEFPRISYEIVLKNQNVLVDNASLEVLFGEKEYRSPEFEVGTIIPIYDEDMTVDSEVLNDSILKKCFTFPVTPKSTWYSFKPNQIGCSIFGENQPAIFGKYFSKVYLKIKLNSFQREASKAFPVESLWSQGNLRIKILSGLSDSALQIGANERQQEYDRSKDTIQNIEFIKRLKSDSIIDFGVDVFNRNFMNFMGLEGHSFPIKNFEGKSLNQRVFSSIPELKEGPGKITAYRNTVSQSEVFTLSLEKVREILKPAHTKRVAFPFPDYSRIDIDYMTSKGGMTISSQMIKDLDSLSQGLRSSLIAEIPQIHVMIYNGHAGGGANVRALLDLYVQAQLDPKLTYLFVLNGCNSFQYTNKDIIQEIRKKAPNFEMIGHNEIVRFDQMVDITATTVSTLLGSGKVSYFDFLAGLPGYSRPVAIDSPSNVCLLPSSRLPHNRDSLQKENDKYDEVTPY